MYKLSTCTVAFKHCLTIDEDNTRFCAQCKMRRGKKPLVRLSAISRVLQLYPNSTRYKLWSVGIYSTYNGVSCIRTLQKCIKCQDVIVF